MYRDYKVWGRKYCIYGNPIKMWLAFFSGRKRVRLARCYGDSRWDS